MSTARDSFEESLKVPAGAADRMGMAPNESPTCPYVEHFAAGDLDIACDLPAGHAGDHHEVPA